MVKYYGQEAQRVPSYSSVHPSLTSKTHFIRWERNPIGELYPVLCLCYYTEAISNLFWFPDGDDFNLKGIVMAMALENSKGTLFCCDVKGCMSCWDVASGICIATKRHFMGLNLPFGSLRRHVRCPELCL